MRKRGFTLAEMLITLGIIGVAAALISPSFKQLIPNKEKVAFMECYKQITTTIPYLNFSPKNEIKKDNNRWTYTSDCIGMACAKDEFEKKLSNNKYTWSLNGTLSSTTPKYYTDLTATCKTGNYSFNFYLNNNGKINKLDKKGNDFMNDQFDYYADK